MKNKWVNIRRDFARKLVSEAVLLAAAVCSPKLRKSSKNNETNRTLMCGWSECLNLFGGRDYEILANSP